MAAERKSRVSIRETWREAQCRDTRGRRRRTKGVSGSKLPHAGQELNETSVEEGESDDNVGGSDTTGLDVDEREDCRRQRISHDSTTKEMKRTERRQGEGRESERSRVSEASVEDGEGGLGVVERVSAKRRRNQSQSSVLDGFGVALSRHHGALRRERDQNTRR